MWRTPPVPSSSSLGLVVMAFIIAVVGVPIRRSCLALTSVKRRVGKVAGGIKI